MNKKMGVIIVGILMVAVIIGILVYQTPNIKQQNEKVFVIGMDDSFPPMGFRNENNELVGFDIDVANEVCKKLGWKLKVQPISWAAKEQELDSGNIDCIWNGFGYTEERAKVMTLSEIYLKGGTMFVVNPDSGYSEQAQLKGKKIGIQTGSTQEEDLENATFGKEVGEIVRYSDYLTALMDLETGNIDAVYMSKITGNYIIKSKNKKFITFDSERINNSRGMTIAFKKGNEELKNTIQKAMNELKEEGKLKEISDKWFGTNLIAE